MIPKLFQNGAEEAQQQHIEEYMKKVSMTEHVSEQLIRPETVGMYVKQGQPFSNLGNDALQHKDDDVDNYEVSNDRCESEHGRYLSLFVL